MKRELFIISIIINFHIVTPNIAGINVFERLLKYWTDLDDGYGEWWRENLSIRWLKPMWIESSEGAMRKG